MITSYGEGRSVGKKESEAEPLRNGLQRRKQYPLAFYLCQLPSLDMQWVTYSACLDAPEPSYWEYFHWCPSVSSWDLKCWSEDLI